MEQDKLKFAKNCKRAEIGFKNRKKLLKDAGIAFIFPAIFAIIMSITFPIIWAVFACITALYGSFVFYAHLCNVNDINQCGKEINFTYKDYNQMKKSGELVRLYKQIEEMQKQEANEMYSQYLDFVKGKTYTPVKTTDKKVENQYEFVEKENNNNL